MKEFCNRRYPNREVMGKAIEFYNAAKVLRGEDGVTSPFIICTSFSIELYIKSLSADTVYDEKGESNEEVCELHSKSDLKGHNLMCLFNRLPTCKKDALRSLYLKKGYSESYPTLDSALEHVKSSFVDFRYSFEKTVKPLKNNALTQVVDIFHEYTYGLYRKNY